MTQEQLGGRQPPDEEGPAPSAAAGGHPRGAKQIRDAARVHVPADLGRRVREQRADAPSLGPGEASLEHGVEGALVGPQANRVGKEPRQRMTQDGPAQMRVECEARGSS